MHHPKLVSSFSLILAVSCGGKSLDVYQEPTETGKTSGSETGSSGDSSGTGSGTTRLPCDVLEDAGHHCVAAHSTARLLRRGYNGPLFQLCRGESVAGPASCQDESLDVFADTGGYAATSNSDEFCAGTRCTVTIIYDQSDQGNDLEPSPAGSAKPTPSPPSAGKALPTLLDGQQVYGMLLRPGQAYRTGCDDCTNKSGQGIPVGDEPETIYMVTSQVDLVDGCCFNYGNASHSTNNDGNGTAEAVYFGMGVIWGTGSDEGPWVMADLENGLYPGWENGDFSHISTNLPLAHDYVTAIVVGDTQDNNDGRGRFALYGGNASNSEFADKELITMYDGIRPEKPGYVPMLKQGSLVLNTASDGSAGGGGRFYEGALATGAATKATLDALHAAIVSANYGK